MLIHDAALIYGVQCKMELSVVAVVRSEPLIPQGSSYHNTSIEAYWGIPVNVVRTKLASSYISIVFREQDQAPASEAA